MNMRFDKPVFILSSLMSIVAAGYVILLPCYEFWSIIRSRNKDTLNQNSLVRGLSVGEKRRFQLSRTYKVFVFYVKNLIMSVVTVFSYNRPAIPLIIGVSLNIVEQMYLNVRVFDNRYINALLVCINYGHYLN
jgi:hypothetical protein